jgi:hypothetical protein
MEGFCAVKPQSAIFNLSETDTGMLLAATAVIGTIASLTEYQKREEIGLHAP